MGLIELLGVFHLKQIDLNVLVLSGARFSKVPITFRARKSVLFARCLH